MFRWLVISFSILFLVGCAPTYKVQKHYIFPNDNASKKCLDNCRIKKDICKRDCETNYKKCLDSAYEKAQDIYSLSDMEYQRKYNEYRNDFNRYYISLSVWQRSYDQSYKDFIYFSKQCKKFKQKYACKRKIELDYTLRRLLETKPKEPTKPTRSSFEEILSKQQLYCKNNCECDDEYDICFNGCGGKIVVEKICIENCKQ